MHGLLFLRNVHSVPCGLVSVSLSSIFDGQLRYAQFFFVTIRNSVASPAEKMDIDCRRYKGAENRCWKYRTFSASAEKAKQDHCLSDKSSATLIKSEAS